MFFGVLHLGAIPVPLYPPVRLGRLDEYHAHRRDAHARPVSHPGHRRARRTTDGDDGRGLRPPRSACSARVLLQSDPIPATPTQPGDIAMVQFSSGTTGEPKPVALTHAQVLANASAILDIEPDDEGFSPSGVTWLPLYHDMGLIGCIFPALLYPASLTLIPPEAFLAKPAIWLRALSRYRGLISPAPTSPTPCVPSASKMTRSRAST